MTGNYGEWTVHALKVELLKRGAVVTSRKKDLIERYVMCSVIMQKSSFDD